MLRPYLTSAIRFARYRVAVAYDAFHRGQRRVAFAAEGNERVAQAAEGWVMDSRAFACGRSSGKSCEADRLGEKRLGN
jgi:hypothetical protein